MSAAGGSDQFECVLGNLLEQARVSSSSQPRIDPAGIRISSLTSDSRRVGRGGCFVAVRGEADDGARYIEDAISRGAVAVVADREISLPPGIGGVEVRDARTALARLAAAYHGFAPGQKFAGMKLIGVTGTNGKTTVSYMIRAILEASDHKAALLGTICYDLVGETIPASLTTPPPEQLYPMLASAGERGADHAVMEVSSHALAQSRCDGHRFACAVFTNLSGDHLDYHKSEDAYRRAKKRLFDQLEERAVVVVNADDRHSDFMLEDCSARVVRFGMERDADVRAEIESMSLAGSTIDLRHNNERMSVALPLVGRHNVMNAAAAAAATLEMGIGPEQVGRGLESIGLVPGRLQRIECRDGGTVFVDFAHSDDALANVLEAVKPLTAGRLWCVFGCGGDRDRTKRPRMASVVASRADVAVVTSDNPRTEDPIKIIDEVCEGFVGENRCEVQMEVDRRRAIEFAISHASDNDSIVIAGKGHEREQLIGNERRHFDDAAVAKEVIGRLRGSPE